MPDKNTSARSVSDWWAAMDQARKDRIAQLVGTAKRPYWNLPWPWFCGHVGDGVAWFRIKGYGLSARRHPSFSMRFVRPHSFVKVLGWHVELLAGKRQEK